MHVVATAGHVDHGKSTLVRGLTGMEPDRWAEERRRGLTIDLGYVWTRLPSGTEVAFVDVPGHRRFIGNMLAGLGPSPAVLFVVAADAGWAAQSAEHLRAVDALGIRHGLLVVTRADLADPAPVMADALERIATSSLGRVPAVAAAPPQGRGLEEVRAAIGDLVERLPAPVVDGRVRLWVDRAFTIKGSGTVVTGTLGTGSVRVGDVLALGEREVTVRGLESLGQRRDEVSAVARVAVNLRGVPVESVHRGAALLTPGAWTLGTTVDVRLDRDARELPEHLTVHLGTAAVVARVRPLSGTAARLFLRSPLPLASGDRGILRDPGGEGVVTGCVVLDVAPPELRRRGAAARRGADIMRSGDRIGLGEEVRRRGVLSLDQARLLGHDPDVADEVWLAAEHAVRVGDHLVIADEWQRWCNQLVAAVAEHERAHPLDPFLPMDAARNAAGMPDLAALETACAAAGLELSRGRVHRPGAAPDLGPARAAVDRIVARLTQDPFAAPEQHELADAGLGTRQIAASVALGLLIRLRDDVLLLPTSPARAMRVLAALDQPFTTSQARQALGTTRRVAIPLLEHLDTRGWTRRLDAGHREVVR